MTSQGLARVGMAGPVCGGDVHIRSSGTCRVTEAAGGSRDCIVLCFSILVCLPKMTLVLIDHRPLTPRQIKRFPSFTLLVTEFWGT